MICLNAKGGCLKSFKRKDSLKRHILTCKPRVINATKILMKHGTWNYVSQRKYLNLRFVENYLKE